MYYRKWMVSSIQQGGLELGLPWFTTLTFTNTCVFYDSTQQLDTRGNMCDGYDVEP